MRSCSALAEKPPNTTLVGRADAGAGLHGDHAFERHGHVDQHAVALLDAIGLRGALANWLTRASSSL